MTFTIHQKSSQISAYQIQEESEDLSWEWLDKVSFETARGQGAIIAIPVETVYLKGTPLKCVISSKGTAWENRIQYIKKIVQDIVKNCPKEDPFVLISMGSGDLLMEYLVGKALFKNGFQKLSFYLIDTAYKFHEQNEGQEIKKIREKFDSLLSQEFHENFEGPLPEGAVRYFSRAENVVKYPTPNSHVVLMEAFPPYGTVMTSMVQYNVLGQKVENTFMGSTFVPPENANALALLPLNFIEQYKQVGTTFREYSSIPLLVLKNPRTQAHFCCDWGCKIFTDGTFLVSFFGGENFADVMGISPDLEVTMPGGKKIRRIDFVAFVEKEIKALLEVEVRILKEKKSDSELTQEDKTMLLLKVEKFIKPLALFKPFFMADYPTDLKELKVYLAKMAGQTYRKQFSCMADPITSFKIEESIIF